VTILFAKGKQNVKERKLNHKATISETDIVGHEAWAGAGHAISFGRRPVTAMLIDRPITAEHASFFGVGERPSDLVN